MVTTAYALTFGGFLLLGGRAADLLGRRRVLMFGLGLFTAASLAAALATSPAFLIATRAVQGLGAAIMLPFALSIVMNMFDEGAERNNALGIWGAIGGAAATVGLIAGGILTRYGGWQNIFYLNVPIGAAALALAPRIVPDSRLATTRRRSDALGAIAGRAGWCCWSTRSPKHRSTAAVPRERSWCWRLRCAARRVRGDRESGHMRPLVERALRIVGALPAVEPVQRTVLAAKLVDGDPHALDVGTPLHGLTVSLLEAAAELDPDIGARAVWSAWNVVVDPISSDVAVLNLPVVGEGAAAELVRAIRGAHLVLTYGQLSESDLRWPQGLPCFSCENPSVLIAAERALGEACPPLVCTGGRPSDAGRLLFLHPPRGCTDPASRRLRRSGRADLPGPRGSVRRRSVAI